MNLSVDHAALMNESSALSSLSLSYRDSISSIYGLVQATETIWQGEDSRAFIAQLESCRPRLMEMAEVLTSFSSMLRLSAQSYQQLEQSRSQAARLL